jgi:hypothetical protein
VHREEARTRQPSLAAGSRKEGEKRKAISGCAMAETGIPRRWPCRPDELSRRIEQGAMTLIANAQAG